MNYKEIMSNSSVFHFTETLCCKFTYMQRYSNFCGIQPVVAYHIKINKCIAINHNKFYYFFTIFHMFQSCWPSSGKYITLKPKIKCIYILIYMQHWNSNVQLVVIHSINHTSSIWPQKMTQYCCCHTPVTNSILPWNSSVDQVLCILDVVVAVRIHFGKEKFLTLHKSSVSVYCLILIFGR